MPGDDETNDAVNHLPGPMARIKQGARGVPILLAGGEEWLLADGGLLNCLDAARDRLFEGTVASGQVRMTDVYFAAVQLLVANYRLDEAEAADLVVGADKQEVVRAVMEAMFGPRDAPRSYTAWATASLLANGLKPDEIPGSVRGFVLDILVATKRTTPQDVFVESIARADAFQDLLSLAKPVP